MLRTCSATLQVNQIKRVSHDGGEYVVIPVVMIVDGVLNDALVTHEEYGKMPEAWNDKPVTIGHPQVNGEYVSAGSPDIIEKSAIGRVYNARVSEGKLIAEIWACAAKAERIGRTELLAVLEAGVTSEVSTGYFSKREDAQGEYNGKPYLHIDRDLIPDHLAILPTEEGACSVKDGCGTRPNVFTRLAQAFGLRTHTTKEESTMCTKKDKVDKLVGNAKLSTEQLELLMSMDEEQLAMMQAIAGGIAATAKAPDTMADEEVTAEVEKEPVDMKAVVNSVRETLRKEAVVERIVANAANVLDAATLGAMSFDALSKYEQSIRPTDYSGAGGTVVTNSGSDVKPLTMSGGLLARKKGA